MATNLVSLVMNFLTPDMIGRIASALGLDRNDTSTAVGAGVPALLAALVGATTKPGGPQKIADAAKQEMGTLDKFASMLGVRAQHRSPTGDRTYWHRFSAIAIRPRLPIQSANIRDWDRPRAILY